MDRFYQHNPNAVFGRSSNGWMDADLFKTWIENVFHPYLIEKHLLRPVILIVDGAKVHISYEISVFCDENQIILYVLLPNSMHILQPLDLVVIGSVKAGYRDAVWRWVAAHPFAAYDRDAFIEVFPKVMENCCTIDNGKKGFEVAGLFPWNP